MNFKSLRFVYYALAAAIMPGLALAIDGVTLPAVDAKKNMINMAVQIQITPRGQNYFSSQLLNILGNMGVSFNEGYFDPQEFKFDQPLNLAELEKTKPQEVKIFNQVRSLMTQWLVGFSINDPRPIIQIGQSEYSAQISKLGISADQKLMNQIGKKSGAVLAIEFEIKKIKVQAESIKAWDLNNESLGKVGLENITLSAGDSVVPLKARIPFYVQIKPDGTLNFQSLKVTQNIQKIPLELTYQKLITPMVGIEINGQKFSLNTQELEKQIQNLTPQFLDFARKQLAQFAEKDLPEILNKKVKESISGGLEQIQTMAPPGADEKDPRPPFVWGLQLQSFQLKNSLLTLGLGAYVEDTYLDPKHPSPAPDLDPKMGAKKSPHFNSLRPTDYDLVMSVDRGLINRILQLSFFRKNFEKIPQADGSYLTLKQTPIVDFIQPPKGNLVKPTEAFLKLHLKIEQAIEKGSFEDWFLSDKIDISFDLIAKLQQVSDKSGLEIVLHSIDLSSVVLDQSGLSYLGKLFKKQVTKGLHKKLTEISKPWSIGQDKIPGKIELPPQLLGLQLDLIKLVQDNSGQIIMYTNFSKK